MAAVTGTTGVWTNNDGLNIKFGPESARPAVEGSPKQAGLTKTYEFLLDFAELPTTATPERFLNRVPGVIIPAGVLLQSAKIVTLSGFASSGSATLSLGLAQPDGTTINATGIDATVAKTAIDTVGETVVCDGALIGTILAADACVTVTVGTADFNAGKGKLLIEVLHQSL